MMLHLDIQKGEEAMKKSIFQKDLGGTTVYIKRLAIANKGWPTNIKKHLLYW